MTFDDQLQRSLGALADRVREEVSRACLAAGEAVTAHANEARDAAAHAASTRAREEAEATARQAAARFERQLEEITAALASRDERLAADLAAWTRLVEALRVIDRAGSLSEILDALIDAASRETTRVGLLLTRRGELRGRRFVGFGAELESARSVAIPGEESGIVGEAVRTGVTVSSAAHTAPAAPGFAKPAGNRLCVAVPMIVSGEVAAVLYADEGSAEHAADSSAPVKWPDTLEVFVRHAARCIEAVTAIKAVRVLTAPTEISVRPPAANADPRAVLTPAMRAPELRATS